MKHTRLIRTASLLCTAALLAGTGISAATPARERTSNWYPLTGTRFTVKMDSPKSAPDEVEFGLPMLENAVRQYLGLNEDEILTEKMLDGITSITFSLSDFGAHLNQTPYEGKTAVKIAFNHGALPGVAEHEDAGYAYEAVPRVIRTEYFDVSAITDEWLYNKFRSFYTAKDPADPLLTPEGLAEMTARYPNTQAGALMYLDPMAKPRELKELFAIADEFGLVNADTFIDDDRIPLTYEDAALFPDLEIIEFMDGLLTAENLPVESLNVSKGLVEEITESVIPESVLTSEAEVVLESPLLNNAVREYFGLTDEHPLTEAMAAQIKTIEFCISGWQEGLVKIEGYEDKTAVKCIVNGGAILDENGTAYPSVNPELPMYEDVFNGMKSVFGYEALPVTVRTKYLEADSIADDWNRVKMQSFYTVKDSADPMLEPEAVEELLIRFPATALDSFVFIDPEAKPRELAALLDIGFAFGLVNEETIIDGTTVVLPMADIAKLPALEELHFDNLSVEYVN